MQPAEKASSAQGTGALSGSEILDRIARKFSLDRSDEHGLFCRCHAHVYGTRNTETRVGRDYTHFLATGHIDFYDADYMHRVLASDVRVLH